MTQDTIIFWMILAAVTAVVGLILYLGMRRAPAEIAPTGAKDVEVYRDQLRSIDQDVERGVMDAEEGARVRIEVSRRLLAADARQSSATVEVGQSAKRWDWIAVLAIVVLLGGAAGIYAGMGQPSYPDMPLKARLAAAEEMRETRPDQARAESDLPPDLSLVQPAAEYLNLVKKLRAAVAERPNDVQGLMLLARNEAALGNYRDAYRAQQSMIDAKADDATAQDYMDLADMMILAAGGYISPEAEDVLKEVQLRDRDNGAARYYTGLLMAQTGRPDLTFRIWESLLNDSAADDPWVEPIRAQILIAADRAGVDYELPELPATAQAPVLPGPDAETVRDAAEMSEADRTEMIRSMVMRLSDRLATEGGTPAEWARLITAYGVLGDTEQAAKIWQEAQAKFASNDAAIATLRQAAQSAGVAQ